MADTEDKKSSNGGFSTPLKTDEYTDNRKLWQWESKFPDVAQKAIRFEARVLVTSLVVTLLAAGLFLGLGDAIFEIKIPIGETSPSLFVSCKLLATFFTGCVGGVTFSIKWLVHTAATGKWHLDRRYWRLLVPCVGGVYALVVLTLFDAGLFGRGNGGAGSASTLAPALAFLVGYFSDGVSGLLSNVANAVFGTLEKK
ncbi:hypothetical protein [Yoonia sp.]|uniref:hypothetical protein n=1 Tax=Yoonia sp. TaxID=2212373 RepID=UPI004047577E